MNHGTRARLVLAAAMFSLAVGCKPEAAPPVAPAPAVPAAPAVPPAAPVEAKPGEVMSLKVNTLDGKAFDLAAQRGHWLVVNMWATWCGPCIEEMPELSALDAMYEDVKVIGLDMEDLPRADLDAFLAKHPVVYPIVQVDPAMPPPGFGSVQFLPKTWLIGPDGTLVKVFAGPVNAARLRAEIDAAGKPKA